MSCEGCRTLAQENNALAEEIAGVRRMVSHAARSEQAMRQELAKTREEEPGAEDIKELLELWRGEVMGGSQRVSVKLGGPRALRVKWALKCYSKDRLADAIMGAKLAAERSESASRYTDIADHIFKNERSIESHEKVWLNHRKGPVPDRPRVAAGGLPSEQQLAEWVARAQATPRLLERLAEVRGWTAPTLARLGVGWNGERLVIPVRDAAGDLLTVVRYLPGGSPKSVACPGRPRGLFPAPETLTGLVWVCEGESDAITAHEIGLPGVAVPGTSGWRDEWAPRFAGRPVIVCMDADMPGRTAARKVALSLLGHASSIRVVDLLEGVNDGTDLTDAVMGGVTLEALRGMADAAPAMHSIERKAA